MVIDFHVHFFPDEIAAAAIRKLEEEGNVKAFGNGTIRSISDQMEKNQIDLSINMPIATRPQQVQSINRKLIELNGINKKVFSFGAMSPEFSSIGNVREELEFIASKGMKGIKLHPEYQSFYPDDPKMTPIYEACLDLDLIICFHAGRDVAFKHVHGTPERLAQVKKVGRELRLIMAHMGGYQMWDEVEINLMGLHLVYFDTSFCHEMQEWQLKEIIFGHGAYKILFASDFPWTNVVVGIDKIKSLGLGALSEKLIFSQNAKDLLGI